MLLLLLLRVIGIPDAALVSDHMWAATGPDAALYLVLPMLWVVGVVLVVWHKLRRG